MTSLRQSASVQLLTYFVPQTIWCLSWIITKAFCHLDLMNVCENKSNLVVRMDVTPADNSFNILSVGYFVGKVQQKVVFQMAYA